MILILCGCSCSGKSTVRDILCKSYNFQRILTTTDRPIRSNETNHVDYEFVSPEVFDELLSSDYFLETTAYQVAISDQLWRYGTPKNIFDNKITDLQVVILNPQGIDSISKVIPKNRYCVCQLTSDEDTIKLRLQERGDNPIEAKRRFYADVKDFQELSPDIVILNNRFDDINDIAKRVYESYLLWKAGK